MNRTSTLKRKAHSYFFPKNFLLQFLFLLVCSPAFAQVSISTTGAVSNTETVSAVTFNFQNTNAFPVIITGVEGILSDYGDKIIEVWYKPSAINGAPGNIAVVNGWTSGGTATIPGIQNMNSAATQPLLGSISITVPANTTYGLAVSAYGNATGTLRVGAAAGTVTVGAGGCNIITGNNIGFASNTVPIAAPTLTPKGFAGKVTFIPGSNCTGTPNAATISGPASVCLGTTFDLTSSGYSLGAGITYQWQKFNTVSGLWEDIAGATTPNFTSTGITASTQFRLKTMCSFTSTQSLSNVLTVTISTGLAGGTYTINNNAQSTSTNFISFNAAAGAMKCGIQGPVTINVAPGSGPYTEQVVFNDIPGTSAANKIRLNGNGAVIQFSNVSNGTSIVKLSGTEYMTMDSLTVRTLNTMYGYGIALTDTASRDSVTRCFVDMRSLLTVSTGNSCGISLSGEAFSTINDYGRSNRCYIGNNHILGSNGEGGPYYGILDGWYNNFNNQLQTDTGNIIAYNEVENFTYFGIITSNVNGTKVLYNDIHRKNKTASTYFYGIRNWDNYANNVNQTYNSYVEIVGNRIHDAQITTGTGAFYGIQSYNNNNINNNTGNQTVLIANNAIYNINVNNNNLNSFGILFWTGDNLNNNNDNSVTKIYHNTIDFSSSTGGSAALYGIYGYDYWNNTTNNDDEVYIKNNLVTITSNTTGAKYGFYHYDYNNTNNNWTLEAQRNNYYLNTTTGTQFYAHYNNVDYLTLAAFQAANPTLEVGSLTVNPQYTSLINGDLTPLNYALYGNGVNLQADVPRDILGRYRSTTPTPGAFEIATDAGVSGLVAPSGTYCSSVKQVKVTIVNAGITTINTVQVHWRLNGVPQTMVTYNGSLLPGASAVVTLGNGLFMPGTPVTIKAWTALPNGQTDGLPYNDTLVVTTQSSTSVPVNLGPDELICTGNTRTLDAGYPGSTYVWDNNATTQTRVISQAGTYYVKLTALDGCIGVDTFVLGLRPLPVVDLGPDREICLGQTTTFDAGHPGATYLWDDGSTQQTRTVDTAGNYEVQVTDQFSCTGVDEVNVGMKDIPICDGINATHADSGTYTFYPLNPLYTISYRWNFGDGSPEVMGYFVQHTYHALGIYTVTLYLEGECTGLIVDQSRTVDVFSVHGEGGTGINEQSDDGNFALYPNPANDAITIENRSDDVMKRLVVYNTLGQAIINQATGHERSHKLKLSGLANGIYTLRLETDKGYVIRKFEVLR